MLGLFYPPKRRSPIKAFATLTPVAIIDNEILLVVHTCLFVLVDSGL